jgi:hypothetical protein
LQALRHRKAEGSRSIARPLTRLDSRGTVATHGGIGYCYAVHRLRACNVKVDVESGGTSFGPPWLVHMQFTFAFITNRMGSELHSVDGLFPIPVLEIVFIQGEKWLREPRHLASKLLPFIMRPCPLFPVVWPAIRLRGMSKGPCKHHQNCYTSFALRACFPNRLLVDGPLSDLDRLKGT